MEEKGLLLVVSGPSGTGKGTVLKPLRARNPQLKYSVSVTTRNPRQEDVPGVTYHFTSKEDFERMIDSGELLEWDYFCGNYYGTPKKFIEENLNKGYDVILEITVPGAEKVKKAMPDCVMIFIAPPSMEELRRRIFTRASEKPEEIQKRLEQSKYELGQMTLYDYIIINDDVEKAVAELEAVITAEKLRYNRIKNKLKLLGLEQEE